MNKKIKNFKGIIDEMKNDTKQIYSLIMIDNIKWDYLLGPQYIVGKNRKLIEVMIGSPLYSKENNDVGIYVLTNNYNDIDHSKIYVFIHEKDFDKDEIIDYAYDLMKEHIYNDGYKVGRHHIHLTKYQLNDIEVSNELDK